MKVRTSSFRVCLRFDNGHPSQNSHAGREEKENVNTHQKRTLLLFLPKFRQKWRRQFGEVRTKETLKKIPTFWEKIIHDLNLTKIYALFSINLPPSMVWYQAKACKEVVSSICLRSKYTLYNTYLRTRLGCKESHHHHFLSVSPTPNRAKEEREGRVILFFSSILVATTTTAAAPTSAGSERREKKSFEVGS